MCGRDAVTRQPFVWMRVYKQGRVYGEMVATSGDVRIRCRECLRWHVVQIRVNKVDFREEAMPTSIPLER